MADFLFHIDSASDVGIQVQLCRQLVAAILDGQLAIGHRLPSSRKLARDLGISRNSVTLAYQCLADEGYIVPRERSGYYVNHDAPSGRDPPDRRAESDMVGGADWRRRLVMRPFIEQSPIKPLDWRKYRYPFIYGQVDPGLFPIAAWRQCSRQALSTLLVKEWVGDSFDSDDPFLIEQICARDLPRRGVRANPEEVLVTLGAQHALYLLAHLLFTSTTTVGVENPSYVEARNIFRLRSQHLVPLSVDDHGVIVDSHLGTCDYVYVTPSHQAPTTVIMPLERRQALIARAAAEDFVVIEDDHGSETNFVTHPTVALKSLDACGRVIYIGSFSKYLAPGLRMCYIVGPAELIHEAQRLRRLMMRHPPSNNQRTLALFLAGGHYDTLIHRLHGVYRARWEAMAAALSHHLPNWANIPTFGGTSYWLKGPEELDTEVLAREALGHGIAIEPGAVHFTGVDSPRNFFRLGFSAIDVEHIEPGIRLLAGLIREKLENGASRDAIPSN